jgi:hypothetical protein
MNRTVEVACSLAAGAGVTYFLDPTTGKRRRALARDQLVKGRHAFRETYETLSQHVGNRAQGAVARVRGWRRAAEIPHDDVLLARVRARLGRLTEHPRMIEASARDGSVTLRGTVSASEVTGLVKAIARVPGVKDVDAQLDVQRPADAEDPQWAMGQRSDSLRVPGRGVWSPPRPPRSRLVTAGAALTVLAWCLTRWRGSSLRRPSSVTLWS